MRCRYSSSDHKMVSCCFACIICNLRRIPGEMELPAMPGHAKPRVGYSNKNNNFPTYVILQHCFGNLEQFFYC